ncbi:hypothetical protein JCM14036_01510 [Desulfotomaculum defluvii]
MPVRKITNRSAGRNLIGKYPSSKMGRTIFWEGTLERDFVSLLEWDANVLEYWEQPIKIKSIFNNKVSHYTPDFLVIKEGVTELVEVKPSNRINNPNTLRQTSIGKDFCLKKGIVFKIVTEEIRNGHLLWNIQMLERYSREKVSLFFINEAISKVINSKLITLEFLKMYMKSKGYDDAIQKIYYLIYRNILKVNLDEPISSKNTNLGG